MQNYSKEGGGIFGLHVHNCLLKIVQRVHNITTTEKKLYRLLQIMLTLLQTRAEIFEFCRNIKGGGH